MFQEFYWTIILQCIIQSNLCFSTLQFFNKMYLFILGHAAWLAGSPFPKQGLNPGHGSESPDS